MDELKKYIDKNRNDFNLEPPVNVWGDIESHLIQKAGKSIYAFPFYKYVAIGLLVISSYLSYSLVQHNSVDSFEARLEALAPEYTEVKSYYNVKMTTGMRTIDDASMKNELLAQLSNLDVLLQDLKSNLEDAPSTKQKEIMHRILNIYKQKIKILDLVVAADKTRSQYINKQI